jgi:tetratricopeptide (TPR) repeat protein
MHSASSSVAARVLVAALVLSCATATAPVIAADGDGGTQSPFSLGVGSRAISLGRSFVSVADDASALYWNPAALRNVQDKQIMGMYMSLFGEFTDVNYAYIGGVYPTLNAGSIGIGVMRVGGDFEGFDGASVPTGTQDYSETQILVGYAFERQLNYLGGRFASGVTFKIANQQVASASSTSPGVDLGFRYVPSFADKISLGVNLQDLVGPEHKLFVEDDKQARTIMYGAGFTQVFDNGSALRLMLQYDTPERADAKFHVGGEFLFSQFAALRVGFDDGELAFGVGFSMSMFGLDYAFLDREAAGTSHPVTFTTHYGQTLYEQRQTLTQRRATEDQQLIQGTFSDRVQTHRNLARQSEEAGNLPLALDEWKIVLEFIPSDPEATERMQALSQTLVDEQSRTARNIEKQAIINTHFQAGLRFYQNNEYVRARAEWQAILEEDSEHAEANDYLQRTQQKLDQQLSGHRRRAAQFEQQRRLVEAIGEWNNVQVLDPGNAEAERAVSRIRTQIESQSRNLTQAASSLRRVNLYNTALQDYNQGNFQKAKNGLEQLLRLQPGHEEAANLLALAKRKLTPLTKTEEEAIRRHYLKGMQFFSKDQYNEAIAEWQKILDIDPTNESVRRNIEEARDRLEQLGQN